MGVDPFFAFAFALPPSLCRNLFTLTVKQTLRVNGPKLSLSTEWKLVRVRETITLIHAWSTQTNKCLFSAVVFCFGRHLLRANDDDDACGFFFLQGNNVFVYYEFQWYMLFCVVFFLLCMIFILFSGNTILCVFYHEKWKETRKLDTQVRATRVP